MNVSPTIELPIPRLARVEWSALPAIEAVVLEGLSRVLSGAPAERVIDHLLRANRDFSAAERQVLAESLFGVGLWRGRLRAQLSSSSESPGPGAMLRAFLAELAGVELSDAPTLRPPHGLADTFSLPPWLADTLVAEAGELAPALARALNQPGPIFLRPNLCSREELAAALADEGVQTRPAAQCGTGLVVTSARPNIFGLSAYREGLFEVQDAGSQVLGEAVHVEPGSRVLDFCAGAGGKSLQLASRLGGTPGVHAYDVDLARLRRLDARARRAGLLVTVHMEEPPPALTFDAVLVDAPCSELGALRRGPDLRWRLDPAAFAPLPELQGGILARAARHVRPGGQLVYATCTFRREENEEVVRQFLEDHPEFARTAPDQRLWPHTDDTDGFFIARLAACAPRRPGPW